MAKKTLRKLNANVPSAAMPGSESLELEPAAGSGESPVRSGVGGDPRLVITSTPLDLELCTLLGDKPSDFVILLADGKTVPGYGTPYDSPTARKNCTYICSRLNEDGEESWWPEFAKNWGNRLAEICPPEHRPVFSWELHRVCVGHSAYLHCAIRLFEQLKDRISSWGVGTAGGISCVEIEMNGKHYGEKDTDLALAIGRAVARALREAGGGGAEQVCDENRERQKGETLNDPSSATRGGDL